MSKTGFMEGRKLTEKMRLNPRRRQFLIDLIVHDIELQELGLSEEQRRESRNRFINTFSMPKDKI